ESSEGGRPEPATGPGSSRAGSPLGCSSVSPAARGRTLQTLPRCCPEAPVAGTIGGQGLEALPERNGTRDGDARRKPRRGGGFRQTVASAHHNGGFCPAWS